MSVDYEWLVEVTATVATDECEVGDVVDVHGCSSCKDALSFDPPTNTDGFECRVVLVRSGFHDKQWAYVTGNAMQEHFRDAFGYAGVNVPKRYLAEFRAAIAKAQP